MIALGAAAAVAAITVNVQFQAFAPEQVDALPGETVTWANVSERAHTVTADDGSFDSGELEAGDGFARRFDSVGAFAYHCTLHPGMAGEVDVRRVILDPLPGAAVPAGRPVIVSGRAAGAAPVTVEQDGGAGFRPVVTTLPDAGGAWRVTLVPTAAGDVRAVSGGDSSETRSLLVSTRHVRVRRARGGVEVTVTPVAPGARVRLQVRRRERFGWWPSGVRRLDYLSRARFRVRRPGRVRAILVGRDRWTPLATSPAVTLRG